MLSHVVVFWTKANESDAADKCLASARRHLANIPGLLSFHVGKMSPSERPVVDQSYQVALSATFADRAAEAAYQAHPQHLAFLEECKPLWHKVVVYDFAG